MQAQEISVGILDLDFYVPDRELTARELSGLSEIPESVITEKFGLTSKHISDPGEHVSDMCISAAKDLVGRNDVTEIDAVVYFGSHWKDYQVWQAAPKVMDALGIEGFAFEAINVSAGAPVALRIVRNMLIAEPDLRSILMVAASKESHLLDYSDPSSRFMFNFGDGAVAAILRRDLSENEVLATSMITDGSFSDHVRLTADGHHLGLFDGEEMKRRLDPITLKNFITVTRECVERSGHEVDDIGLLLPIHFKRSLHDQILTELGISPEQTIYLDTYGHMSAVDPLLSLALARRDGKVKDGDLVVLLAAGTGYTWAATAVRWGGRG